MSYYFFFYDPATTEIYTSGHTRSLHDALPIAAVRMRLGAPKPAKRASMPPTAGPADVGGTNARQTCIHAPNRGTGRRSGHQYPPNVHPRPQPRDRPTFGAPIPAKRASKIGRAHV